MRQLKISSAEPIRGIISSQIKNSGVGRWYGMCLSEYLFMFAELLAILIILGKHVCAYTDGVATGSHIPMRAVTC